MTPEEHNHSQATQEHPTFKNRKLGKLLKRMSSKEMQKFQPWLENELTPKRKNLLIFSEMVFAKEQAIHIWQNLFPDFPCPGSPFNDSGFRKIESQLVAYIEEYLAIEAFRKSTYQKEIMLLKELNRRDADELFDLKMRKVKRKMEKTARLEKEYFMMEYQLELEMQKHLNKDHSKRKDYPAGSLGKKFDLWWLHKKLWLANHDLNFQQVKGEQISTLFLEEILDLVERNPAYKEYTLLGIYHKLYKLRKEGGNSEEVKTLLYHHAHELGATELHDIFSLFFGFFTQKSNSSKERESLKTMLNLLLWGIDEKIIFIRNYLPWNWYKNLITICIRLGFNELAFEYLDTYKQYLHPKDREAAYRFSLAHCYFSVGRFTDVIKISALKYPNVYYEMHGRLIQCKARYELGEIDGLETRLRSLRVYVNRQKKISHRLKKSYTNQIKVFESLVKAFGGRELQKLKAQLQFIDPLASKEWFLRKINEKLRNLNIDVL